MSQPAREREAKDAIPGLIDRIILTPERGPGRRMIPRIDLRGSLAAILALSLAADRTSGQKKPPANRRLWKVYILVAVGRSQKYCYLHSAERLPPLLA